MTKHEIEEWALRIVARVKTGAPLEDSRAELKREWPSHEKAARRIAAHANASGGEPILWLIGVDEKTGVVGAQDNKFVDWWNQVKSIFDDVYPNVVDVITTSAGVDLCALLFDTSRLPYVIKHGDRLEVPWREATGVRSAKREELLRMLVPRIKIPNFEILSTEVMLVDTMHQEKAVTMLSTTLRVYVMPQTSERVVLPFHKCSLHLRFDDDNSFSIPLSFNLPVPTNMPQKYENHSTTIQKSTSELVIDGPGTFLLTTIPTICRQLHKFGQLTVSAVFQTVNSQASMTIEAGFIKPSYHAGDKTIWRGGTT